MTRARVNGANSRNLGCVSNLRTVILFDVQKGASGHGGAGDDTLRTLQLEKRTTFILCVPSACLVPSVLHRTMYTFVTLTGAVPKQIWVILGNSAGQDTAAAAAVA